MQSILKIVCVDFQSSCHTHQTMCRTCSQTFRTVKGNSFLRYTMPKDVEPVAGMAGPCQPKLLGMMSAQKHTTYGSSSLSVSAWVAFCFATAYYLKAWVHVDRRTRQEHAVRQRICTNIRGVDEVSGNWQACRFVNQRLRNLQRALCMVFWRTAQIIASRFAECQLTVALVCNRWIQIFWSGTKCRACRWGTWLSERPLHTA